MSQCTTRADLHEQWARVLRMCEEEEITAEGCWKFYGDIGNDDKPYLDCEISAYEFAIAIIERKPVFIGDTLYIDSMPVEIQGTCTDISGSSCLLIGNDIRGSSYHPYHVFTWNPPEPKTLMDIARGCGAPYVVSSTLSGVVMTEELLALFKETINKPIKTNTNQCGRG